MPDEVIHPYNHHEGEKPPEYAQHIDDPTHPAGNKELAEGMAAAGDNARSDAAEYREDERQANKSGNLHKEFVSRELKEEFDRVANNREEQVRAEYLEAHPELTQGQETAADVGGEVLERARIDEPEYQDDSSEEGKENDETSEKSVEQPEEELQQAREEWRKMYETVEKLRKMGDEYVEEGEQEVFLYEAIPDSHEQDDELGDILSRLRKFISTAIEIRQKEAEAAAYKVLHLEEALERAKQQKPEKSEESTSGMGLIHGGSEGSIV